MVFKSKSRNQRVCPHHAVEICLDLLNEKVRSFKPDLPPELFSGIWAHIAAPDMLPILLTCKAFRAAGEAQLYRHICLDGMPHRSILLCRTLVHRPELCKYLLDFSPDILWKRPSVMQHLQRALGVSMHQFPFHHSQTRSDCYRMLCAAICQLSPNIRALSLRDAPHRQSLVLQTMPEVRKFRTANDYGFKAYVPILESLGGITHLELPLRTCMLDTSEIRPHHVPRLEVLVCDVRVAMQLVPGRPIRRLFVGFTFFQPGKSIFEVMARLGTGTVDITDLGLAVLDGWPGDLSFLLDATCDNIPEIRELHLHLRFRDHNNDNVFLRDLLRTVCQNLFPTREI